MNCQRQLSCGFRSPIFDFCQNTENEHVHLYLDNTVAIKLAKKSCL